MMDANFQISRLTNTKIMKKCRACIRANTSIATLQITLRTYPLINIQLFHFEANIYLKKMSRLSSTRLDLSTPLSPKIIEKQKLWSKVNLRPRTLRFLMCWFSWKQLFPHGMSWNIIKFNIARWSPEKEQFLIWKNAFSMEHSTKI